MLCANIGLSKINSTGLWILFLKKIPPEPEKICPLSTWASSAKLLLLFANTLTSGPGSVWRKNASLLLLVPTAFLLSFLLNFKCCCPGKSKISLYKRRSVRYNKKTNAPVMELADMRDLGSRGVSRWGSSPHTRTRLCWQKRCAPKMPHESAAFLRFLRRICI